MERRENCEHLRMALVGYEAERLRIEAAIAGLRRRLGSKAPTSAAPQKKHRISPEGRARIAAAQRRRWAAARKVAS